MVIISQKMDSVNEGRKISCGFGKFVTFANKRGTAGGVNAWKKFQKAVKISPSY
jgi:hypothetical protein